VDSGAEGVVDLAPAYAKKVQAHSGAVEAWREASWYIGWGKKAERAALEETDAVWPTFIDRVAALAARCDGEEEAIIEALRAGELKGFRENKMDDLEAYFEQKGYVDTAEPLTEEGMRSRALARMRAGTEESIITSDDLWAILGRL